MSGNRARCVCFTARGQCDRTWWLLIASVATEIATVVAVPHASFRLYLRRLIDETSDIPIMATSVF